MNCHGNNDQKGQDNGHKKHLFHSLLMVLCCAVPVAILLLLPLLRIKSAGANSVTSGLATLICPLMMGVMMFSMMKKDKNKNSGQAHVGQQQADKIEQVNEKQF